MNTHPHRHDHQHAHGHSHGIVDPAIATSEQGLWATKWSFIVFAALAVLQLFVVFVSGSVALFADAIHNFADAATAIPLAIAFLFSRKKPTESFTFGFGRIEDLACVIIVLTILASAIVAGYESIQRFYHPQDISHLWAVILASIFGFAGNEAVAIFRLRIGRKINSVALIAEGHHARIDGWTSLSVLIGAVGVWLGYPLADPIIGLLITVAIFGIVIQSGKSIFTRMLDATDPRVIDEIRHTAEHVPQVEGVTEVRARWIGHRMHTELNIAVASHMSISDAHAVAANVRHALFHSLNYLSLVVVHVDPADQSGEAHHRIGEHTHDGLPVHSHS